MCLLRQGWRQLFEPEMESGRIGAGSPTVILYLDAPIKEQVSKVVKVVLKGWVGSGP